MKKNEEILNESEEVLEKESTELVEQNENYVISDFKGIGRSSQTKIEVFTNITDNKVLFNLENKVDALLNDCENEMIRVKDILIKRYEKPMKEPIVDEETGEIVKDIEFSMSCVIVDDKGKSYATGSKTFTIQMMRYLQMQARLSEGQGEPFDIKIIKKKTPNGNKALSFELV